MSRKPFGLIVVIVAVVIAALEIALSPMPAPDFMAAVISFFEVMLPVLATGALIKYLTCCEKKSCCSNNNNSNQCR